MNDLDIGSNIPDSYKEFEKLWEEKFQSSFPVTPTSRLADLYEKLPNVVKTVFDLEPSGLLGGIATTLERDYSNRLNEQFKRATCYLMMMVAELNKELKAAQKAIEHEKLERATFRYYESSLRTNQKEKIEYFARVWKSSISEKDKTIDSVDEIYDILDRISLAQIHILVFAYKKQGEKILTLRQPLTCYELAGEVKVVDERSLFLCIQLVGMGLMQDFGVGRFDYKGPEKFIITDFAVSLVEDILGVNKNEAAIKRSAVT